MNNVDRVLAVLDPTSDAQPALGKAAELATAFGATLELFACDFDPALASPAFLASDRLQVLREQFLGRSRRLVDRYAETLRARGLKVETEVRWDHPVHRGIVARVEQSRPGLVVKDTHHHGILRRTLFTNTDWNLIRTCPAPLLLAKEQAWKRPPVVLAAVDPGHAHDKPAALDHALLEQGKLIAAKLGGELHVLHAFFPAALIAATSGMAGAPVVDAAGIAALVDAERDRVSEALSGLAREHGLPAEHVRLAEGTAASVFADAISRLGVDLVVMGAIARSHLADVIVGSTAERVLDRLPCDVLVVKPPGYRSARPRGV